MAEFASQFGNPGDYPLLVRAKLVGSYGVIARLLDVVQRNTIAPYANKNKPPKSILPEPQKQDERHTGYAKEDLDDILGISRRGAGMGNDGESGNSDSVDTGPPVA